MKCLWGNELKRDVWERERERWDKENEYLDSDENQRHVKWKRTLI